MLKAIKQWWTNFTAPEFHLMHPEHGSVFYSKDRSLVETAQWKWGDFGGECTIMMSI